MDELRELRERFGNHVLVLRNIADAADANGWQLPPGPELRAIADDLARFHQALTGYIERTAP